MDSDDRPVYFCSLTKEEKLMLLKYRMMSQEDQEQFIEIMKEISNDLEDKE